MPFVEPLHQSSFIVLICAYFKFALDCWNKICIEKVFGSKFRTDFEDRFSWPRPWPPNAEIV